MNSVPRSIIAVVPAAGIGSRMQQDKPKQYLQLQGKTILQYSLEILLNYPQIEKIFLAVVKDDPYLATLPVVKHSNIVVVEGGSTRANSVLNALKVAEHLYPNAWVLVHDAARPCLRHQDLDKLLRVQDENGAILAIPATDTIKRSNQNLQIQQTEDRNQIWLAQTPQFFPLLPLQQALTQAFVQGIEVTDEASAMEFMGYKPHLVEGRRDNLKITHPEDLALAEFYLSRKIK